MPVDTSTAPPDANTLPQPGQPTALDELAALHAQAAADLQALQGGSGINALPTQQDPATELTFQAVDLSFEQEQLGIHYAEQKLAAKFSDAGNRVQKMARALWYNNIAREWYIDKYRREFSKNIDGNSDDLYTQLGISSDASKAAIAATVQRLTDDEHVYEDAGETQRRTHEEGEQESDLEKEIRASIKQLVLDRAGIDRDDKLDDESFRTRQHDLLKDFKDKMPHLFEGANLLASNLNQLVASVEALASHVDGLDAAKAALDSMNLRVANARPGLSTEAYQTAMGKLADKLHTRKWLNGTTVGLALLGVSVGISAARSVGTTAAKLTGGLGLGAAVAGTFAALRERYVVNREMHFARRENAVGNNSGRLAQYEAAQYRTISAEESISLLKQLAESPEDLSPERADIGLQAIAQVRERLQRGDRGDVDLIRYSTIARDPERWALQLAAAQAEARIRQSLGAEPLRIQQNEGEPPIEISIDEYLTQLRQVAGDTIANDMSERDKAFHALRRKRMGTAFGVAAGTSLGLGLIGLGIHALADGTPVPTDSGSALETPTHTVDIGSMHVVVPEGITATQDGNTVTIFGGIDSHQIATIELDANGVPTPESIDALQNAGISTELSTKILETPSAVSVDEYFTQHADHLTSVHTAAWIESPDEFGLRAGGVDGSWLDANGNVNIDVSGMADQPDVISITATGVHQGAAEVFQVVDGHVVIPPSQLSHDLFSSNEFHGGVMQAANIQGGSIDGGQIDVESLAAFRGTDTAQLMGTVSHVETTVTLTPDSDVLSQLGGETVPQATAEAVTPTAPFVAVPIFARQGLGNVNRREPEQPAPQPATPTLNTSGNTAPSTTEAQASLDSLKVGNVYRNDEQGMEIRIDNWTPGSDTIDYSVVNIATGVNTSVTGPVEPFLSGIAENGYVLQPEQPAPQPAATPAPSAPISPVVPSTTSGPDLTGTPVVQNTQPTPASAPVGASSAATGPEAATAPPQLSQQSPTSGEVAGSAVSGRVYIQPGERDVWDAEITSDGQVRLFRSWTDKSGDRMTKERIVSPDVLEDPSKYRPVDITPSPEVRFNDSIVTAIYTARGSIRTVAVDPADQTYVVLSRRGRKQPDGSRETITERVRRRDLLIGLAAGRGWFVSKEAAIQASQSTPQPTDPQQSPQPAPASSTPEAATPLVDPQSLVGRFYKIPGAFGVQDRRIQIISVDTGGRARYNIVDDAGQIISDGQGPNAAQQYITDIASVAGTDLLPTA